MVRNTIKYNLFASIILLIIVSGCNDFLEVKSLTKISADQLLSSEKGMKTLLANLYNGAIPMEDFVYLPNLGFNRRGWNNPEGMHDQTFFTDDAIKSDGDGSIAPGSYNWWTTAYSRNRDLCIFMKNIEESYKNGIIKEDTYNRLRCEGHFIRAYLYFGLVKRFGGVPIIDWVQDDTYFGDPEPLFVDRATEVDTWKYILSECDKAIEYLPTVEDFTDGDPRYRANKWAAYALKSRAALYAASLAKFDEEVQFYGNAVDMKLVKISKTDADFFYNECINASKAIIDHSGYMLYKPNPANATEATSNYQDLFMYAPPGEVIFGKAYLDGSIYGDQGHGFDTYFRSSQISTGFHKWGRYSVTLDLVDLYEDYTDDGTGTSAKIVTRTDGVEDSYIRTNTPSAADISSIPFVKYDHPLDPFRNKDARLHASVLMPGSVIEGTTIVMQGGMIRKNGAVTIYEDGNEEGLDGVMYYTYGAESPGLYSGFANMSVSNDANYPGTGFSIRKFLMEGKKPVASTNSSTTPWIDFRLAEIYLNYAEAVVENGGGYGDKALATRLINDLRKRAAHKDDIPLTAENVQKERRIEMAFEHQRLSDLWRRREYHILFSNYRRHSLVPLIDLRENPPKTVFLRTENFQDVRLGGRTFQTINYYYSIPGTNVNRLINNPGRE